MFARSKGDRPTEARPLPRVADDVAVQRARATIEDIVKRIASLRQQIDAEREQIRTVDVSASDAPRIVADAQTKVSGLSVILTRSEQEEARARSALERALADAKTRLRQEHLARIHALLDKQENALWQVRDLQTALDSAVQDALAEDLDIGIGPSRYWSVGFPGFPFLRRDEEIMTWLRGRSIAPRARSLLEGRR